jgi:molybdopterin-guanine dinucleotide biosynthesis protein A
MTVSTRNSDAREQITGLILCGGRGQRVGGADKPLLVFQGQPLVARVAAMLAPQVQQVLISANRNSKRYGAYGSVVADALPDYAGPLAGISAALDIVTTPLLFACPGDGPNLPGDIVSRLTAALKSSEAAVAHDGKRRQLLYLLLRTNCRASLKRYLESGQRSVHGWLETLDASDVQIEETGAFRNINDPADFD